MPVSTITEEIDLLDQSFIDGINPRSMYQASDYKLNLIFKEGNARVDSTGIDFALVITSDSGTVLTAEGAWSNAEEGEGYVDIDADDLDFSGNYTAIVKYNDSLCAEFCLEVKAYGTPAPSPGTAIDWSAYTGYSNTDTDGPYRAGTNITFSANADGSQDINASGGGDVTSVDGQTGDVDLSGVYDALGSSDDVQTELESQLCQVRGTEVITGGGVSFTLGETEFDVEATTGYIKDSTGCYEIDYAGETDIELTSTAVVSIYVYIDNSGAIGQQTTEPTLSEFREKLFLTRIALVGGVINAQEALINPAGNYTNLVRDFLSFIQSPKKGLALSGNSDLTFKVASGSIFELGANFGSDPDSPNETAFSATDPQTFFHWKQDGLIASGQTSINVTQYDNGGTMTTMTNNRFKILTVYKFGSGNVAVQEGQAQYLTIDSANTAISTRSFVPFDGAENGTRLGWIIVEKNASDLTDADEARFVNDRGAYNTSTGTVGALLASNNLSDLANVATALTNLGAYSSSEVDTLLDDKADDDAVVKLNPASGAQEIESQSTFTTLRLKGDSIYYAMIRDDEDGEALLNYQDETGGNWQTGMLTNFKRAEQFAYEIRSGNTGDIFTAFWVSKMDKMCRAVYGLVADKLQALTTSGTSLKNSAGTTVATIGESGEAEVQVTGSLEVSEKQATAYLNTDTRVATMVGDETLTASSAMVQFLDPSDSDRNLDLPDSSAFTVQNTGDGGEVITVRDSSDATIDVVENGVTLSFIYDGTNWQVIG